MKNNEQFDFSEALRRMKEGKWVKRKSEPFCYAVDNTMEVDIICYKVNDRNIALGVAAMNTPDILATDWEEVEG